MRFFLSGVHWALRAIGRSFTLLRQNDAVAYYTLIGDDVIDFKDEGFANPSKPLWLNLGYWKNARTYPDACVAMVKMLGGRAELKSGDRILDVGVGFAEQDLIFLDQFDVEHITGIDITPIHVSKAQERVWLRGLEKRIEIRLASATSMEFPDASFGKVIALECAFHFDSREAFFREAFRVLKPEGTISITDMLPSPGMRRGVLRRLGRKYSHIPEVNYYDRHEYVKRLRSAGFYDISMESIRENVYPGMAKYIHERLCGKKMDEIVVDVTDDDRAQCRGVSIWERLSGLNDYVVVTARKPLRSNGVANGSVESVDDPADLSRSQSTGD